MPVATGYARFCHFTVQQRSSVTIAVDHSDTSYRLVLRDSDGTLIKQITYHPTLSNCWEAYGLDCDRWISSVLEPGDYVVEDIQHFSHDGREMSFTVSVSGEVSGAVLPGVSMLSAVTVAVETEVVTPAPEVLILPADADPNTEGHQVEVAEFGLTPVAVIVTDVARSVTEVHRLVFSGD